MTETPTFDFTMTRLGQVMKPDPNIPEEVEGVLNPAAVRGRDGELYLFPRVVGYGNYSRVGKARVLFDDAGNPAGVERLGYALQPQEPFEKNHDTGGCEDPRITHFQPFDNYAMTYTAWGPTGPRIALAVSDDLKTWHRRGRINFLKEPGGVDFDLYHDKDALIFPEAVPGPDGRPSLALIHRPVYETRRGSVHDVPPGITDPRPSIWISFCPLDDTDLQHHTRLRVGGHYCLAQPSAFWEDMRIGGGAPPIRTKHGWLLVYHGVSGWLDPLLNAMPGSPHETMAEKSEVEGARKSVEYRAGVMLLDLKDPRRVLYRTTLPVLEPSGPEELQGVVNNVVFPTGLDVRTDIGQPNRVDVYYGCADSRIAAATFTLPE